LANTYTQAIEIRLKVEQLNRELRQIEERLKKIQQVDVKISSVQAAATETQKLQNNIQKAVQSVNKFGQGFKSALASVLLMTGLFDKQLGTLEKELKVMENINTYFKQYSAGLTANVRSLNSIDRALRGVDNAWGKITYNVEVYERLAKRQVELERTRAVILRRQADALRQQRAEQEAIYNKTRINVRTSQESRGGSGFREFSQAAGGAVRRRVEADRKAERAAIEDIEKLRETKALNSYNTAQRRKRYLAQQDQKNIDEYFRAENKRIRRVEDAEKAAARRTAKFRENLLLGAGFPLLFGGGAGAVGGGLLGSLFGDGFGGQIFLSAIGTQLDQLSLFTQNLAKAFREGGDAAGFLEQTLGYLDPTTKRLISNLQESGQTAAAAAEAQRVLADQIGVAGANALRRAGEESDQYSRSIKKLALEFYGAALAASQFFQNLRGDFGRIPGLATPVQEEPTTQASQARLAELQRGNALLQERGKLSGISRKNDAEAYATQQKQIAQKEYDNELARIKEDLDERKIGLAEREERKTAAKLKYDNAIKTANRQLTEEKQRQAEVAAREAQQADKRLQQEQIKLNTLRAQVEASNKIVGINTQLVIAEAEGLDDEVFRLNILKIEAELEGEIARIKAQKFSTAEEINRITLAENQATDKLLQLDLQRAIEQNERQKSFEETLKSLEYEVRYEEAITREQRNQLELEEAIRKAQGNKFTPQQQKQIADVTKRRQEQQRPIRQYMKQLEDSLNDTEGQIVQLAQAIETELGSAMSNAITGLVTGTQTVEEAFSQMFANIGKAFIDMATQLLAQQLILSIFKMIMGPTPGGGGLPGFSMEGTLAGEGIFTGAGPFKFAEGGYPPVGQPSIVGEEGPELFVPGQPGMIVPNDVFEATRSAIGGGGGGSAAFDENREALNSVTTLNRERQVERLLTSGATSTEIRYSRVGSGDLPFVTEENMLQATRVAAQEGARLGQARTLAALKNNPGTRRSVGI
jgi:hypothetical protein